MNAYRTKISSKGQVVIPAELREQLGLSQGTPATWTEDDGRLILTPMSLQRIRQIRGCLKPAPGEPTMFDELFTERARERRREDQ
jgi:AbrB family looped-hinge helix DNA binding protein